MRKSLEIIESQTFQDFLGRGYTEAAICVLDASRGTEFTLPPVGSRGRQERYGNVFEGFEVTDSLPMPRRTGVFAAMENLTSGALSVKRATVALEESERGGASLTGPRKGVDTAVRGTW
jgi:hypothetical protein